MYIRARLAPAVRSYSLFISAEVDSVTAIFMGERVRKAKKSAQIEKQEFQLEAIFLWLTEKALKYMCWPSSLVLLLYI